MKKGCEAYFAYVIGSKMSKKKVESVPVIREVEFGIELIPGTARFR